MTTIPVMDSEGKKTDTIDLPEKLFGEKINKAVLHQAIVMYLACQRQGTASTKEKSSVSGGGKKPWRQKGTGRARAGSNRSPLWMGGGVVFGPHPRDFSYSVPKKIKTQALRESINAKLLSKDLLCVSEFKVKTLKTKDFAKALDALKLQGKILALLDGCDESIARVSRNLPFFRLMRSQDVNAYDVLSNKKLLLTKKAFTNLLKRIK